ncbi:PREDICTED: serologically defined colon cancer antigen 8 homolog [Ceratosolen solmsi marchali]|uniref:Serologically defined colon cancer antigen 8 homolog n=1 Tax=Ceratosolen solmsi marchali TaxID=326594 RepID=A0AAJ6YBT6_9HYME|nr:PREDICTED: serologically defined colon cancer antigen 8 homolog [Ceratosolen solmsi marchali]
METIRKKFPNHTEIAYREAVSKLKYLLAESYAPKIAFAKPPGIIKKSCKDNVYGEDYSDDADVHSVISDVSKKEPSTRIKYYASRLSNVPMVQVSSSANDRLALPSTELTSFIGRQEEYIEQLERESRYCKEELKSLVEKVKEVVSENEALHNKNKSSFFETVLENCADKPGDEDTRSSRKSTLEGPSIVFESRISELEAQLTQARLELRKAREENQENLMRLAERKDEPQLHLELDRALREKRELEAKGEELRRELDKWRARDTDVETRSKRAAEVVQQAEYEKVQAEAEVRRLKDELEKRREKLREALHDTSKRLIEEKQLVERKFSQQIEQLSADVASHWEAASKSQLESEKQKRQVAELKRDIAQKLLYIEDLKKELQAKTCKMQEELKQATAERDASQEEVSNVKLSAERCERQSRQEQSRLQSEINSYKMRLERADADLMHARRENLRLTEEIASLEKEINMNKIVEETRVGSQPPRYEKGKDEKDKDKELASLIFDLESKQAKTIASLEDTLSKQASLISRLTAECQSLTQRLETNEQNHKEKMANLQTNVEYLSNKISEYFDVRELNTEELDQIIDDTDLNSTEMINDQEASEGNNESHEEINSSSSVPQFAEEQNLNQINVERQENYGDDYSNESYNQYNQYDPIQYEEYYNNQQYSQNQECSDSDKYLRKGEYVADGEQRVENENNEEKLQKHIV